jgi:hypothetical protein
MSRFIKTAAVALVLASGAATLAQADTSIQNAIRTGSIITPHGLWDGK